MMITDPHPPRCDRHPRSGPGQALSRRAGEELLLDPFDDCGDALADADAHRDERISAAGTVQLPRRGQCDARAGGAERMADRDGAAIRVDAAVVERDFEAA